MMTALVWGLVRVRFSSVRRIRCSGAATPLPPVTADVCAFRTGQKRSDNCRGVALQPRRRIHRYGRMVSMIEPSLATSRHVAEIWSLRRQREDWLAAAGIDQWRPGEVPEDTVREQVDQGEWFVVERERVVAGLRLLWADPEFWGLDDGSAVYVHGLMVDLKHAGRGLGRDLLSWAAHAGRARGRTRLRLDSAATNPALSLYYETAGFTAVGQVRTSDELFDAILWERPIP